MAIGIKCGEDNNNEAEHDGNIFKKKNKTRKTHKLTTMWTYNLIQTQTQKQKFENLTF
jgi:hypothetical protein